MEMRAHSLAASLMCWAAGPLSSWEWKYTDPVASGSAYLMEGIWLRLERYLNFKYIH